VGGRVWVGVAASMANVTSGVAASSRQLCLVAPVYVYAMCNVWPAAAAASSSCHVAMSTIQRILLIRSRQRSAFNTKRNHANMCIVAFMCIA